MPTGAGSTTASLVSSILHELLLERERIVDCLCFLSFRLLSSLLRDSGCLSEMLLQLCQRDDLLVELEHVHCMDVVALSQQSFASSTEGVDAELLAGDDVHQVLKDVLVDSDRCRVEALQLQQVNILSIYRQNISCEGLAIKAGVASLERHQLIADGLLVRLGQGLSHVQLLERVRLTLGIDVLLIDQDFLWSEKLEPGVSLLSQDVVFLVVVGEPKR